MRKVALVTGGALRLGAAIVRLLAAEGWQVVIHCNSSRQAAEALATELRGAGRDAVVIQADLADRAAVDRLAVESARPFGPLTCLVNNASVFQRDELATLSWESWDQHLAPNLAAPLFLMKCFAEALPEDETGNIVNVLDQKVANPNPDFLSYTVSKLALASLMPVLARALAPRIRVNGVAPGLTLISNWQTQETFERAWRDTPLGRGSTPEDVAAGVLFLLSTPSITAQTLIIDGGESLTKRLRDISLDPKFARPAGSGGGTARR
jgi:NAD(P)-dependent dehydrogenase (short-subunit alcohol dehydrogenase family)